MPNLDLNLLVALHALLQERSVTRAAQRLGLTQPTLSASLARLRRHYQDELLHRVGHAYELTPLGVHLAGRTGVALDGVERLLAAQATSDPAASEREFVIVTSDYGASVVGPPLAAELSRLAPRATLYLRQSDPGPFASDDDRLRAVDGVVMPHGHFRDLPHRDLYRDRWVCIVDAGNDGVGESLSAADLSRLPWASTSRLPARGTTGMRALVQAGVEIRVQAAVDVFGALPLLVVGTDRIALVPERVATLLAPPGLRVLECPLDPGPIVVALWWHPDFARDAEHAWLRHRVVDAVALRLE